MGTKRSFFKKLNELGGQAFPFLGTRSALTDFRLNFRDHRKIVVIDGKIGYVGGFNVGDQYLGRKEKFGYWRDTHLKIVGSGVYSLQSRFILDWNATDRAHPISEEFKPGSVYFPVAEVKGHTSLQIVSSGPDSDIEKIKMGYLKMINAAKKSIWIQSPYLIPDDSVLDALRLAANSELTCALWCRANLTTSLCTARPSTTLGNAQSGGSRFITTITVFYTRKRWWLTERYRQWAPQI